MRFPLLSYQRPDRPKFFFRLLLKKTARNWSYVGFLIFETSQTQLKRASVESFNIYFIILEGCSANNEQSPAPYLFVHSGSCLKLCLFLSKILLSSFTIYYQGSEFPLVTSALLLSMFHEFLPLFRYVPYILTRDSIQSENTAQTAL